MHRLKRWHSCRRNSSLYIVNDPFTFIPLFKRASPPTIEMLRLVVPFVVERGREDRRQMRRKSRENLECEILGKIRRDSIKSVLRTFVTRVSKTKRSGNENYERDRHCKNFIASFYFVRTRIIYLLNRSLQFSNFCWANQTYLLTRRVYINVLNVFYSISKIRFEIYFSRERERERSIYPWKKGKKRWKGLYFSMVEICVRLFFESFFRN